MKFCLSYFGGFKNSAVSWLFLVLFFVLNPGSSQAQGTPRIKVTKKANTTYGEGGYEKTFIRRNLEIKLIHDKYNYPREEVKTFTYPDGAYKINTWYFDLKNKLDHFSSYYYDTAKTKQASVEAYYTNNRLLNAYGNFTGNGNSQTARYDINAGKFIKADIDFDALEKYRVNLQYSGMTKVFAPVQPDNIRAFMKRKDYSETKPDNTYTNGTKKITIKGNNSFGDGTEEFYDGNGVLRKSVYYEYDPEYDEDYIETTFYDCNGQIVHYTEEYICPDCGYVFEVVEIDYENGQAVSGYRDYKSEFTNAWEYEEYDPETDSFRDPMPRIRKLSFYVNPKIFAPNNGECGPNLLDLKKNNFYAGPSLAIDKNGSNSLNFLGGKFTYQYNPCARAGVYVDLEAHFKSLSSVKYTQLGAYLGGAYAPLKKASYTSPLTWTVRLEAGYTNFTTKTGSNTNSSGNVTIGAGSGLEYNFGNNFFKGVGLFPYYRLNLAKGKNFNIFNVALQAKF